MVALCRCSDDCSLSDSDTLVWRFVCYSFVLLIVEPLFAANMSAEQETQRIQGLWVKWLKDVDNHAEHDEEFLAAAAQYLVNHNFRHWEMLAGAVSEDLPRPLPAAPVAAFLNRAIKVANSRTVPIPAGQPSQQGGLLSSPATPLTMALGDGASANNPLEMLTAALQAHGPKAEEKCTVNIGDELRSANMRWLPAGMWPKQDLVDDLANENAKSRSKSGKEVFTYVDLAKRALAPWVTSIGGDDEAEEKAIQEAAEKSCATISSLAQALKTAAKPARKNLTLVQWLGAYQRWAVAAAATGQLHYSSAQAHLDCCLRVGEAARAKGRHQTLAMVYDEVSRKDWAEKVKASAPGFDLHEACCSIDKEILERAEALFDERGKPKPKDPKEDRRRDGEWNHRGNGYGHWGKRQYEQAPSSYANPPWKKRRTWD